ncbi:UvrD-helicase domain-containing protein [Paenibacillus roseipurpureus]|uniref:DNA 3'-5' helicase n=1 Tax=Paenibacillus roseopurpureus TaxID=2918901 RepID=A0AA96RN78_9BACL|nr:UvrD-helicase domain-containing protein [Paenibacillus sp. MBLB1832]WNR45127.1 UvrD-helicase domain-containing protein [Paenibacillus sp. MBLB1832]
MLTNEQKIAVESTEHRILIRAGAGTGKTEVLTRRILHLLEHNPNVTLRNFAIITFTNKATENVKDRLKRHLYSQWLHTTDIELKMRLRAELESLNLVKISTIHQFCRAILDYAGPSEIEASVYYSPSYKVNDSTLLQAADNVMQRWLQQEDDSKKKVLIGLWPAHELRGFLIEAYQLIKNKGLILEQVLEQTRFTMLLKEDGNTAIIKECYIFLLKELKEEEAKLRLQSLSTDGLLEYASKLLKQNPRLVERMQDTYKYLFVDEFQDTSAFQTDILRMICDGGEAPSSLFVVGDLKQSIYQFRGADINSYKSVEDWIEKTGTVLTLRTNFRSTKPLVNFVNTTFRGFQNDEKLPLFEAEDLNSNAQEDLPMEDTIHYVLAEGAPVEEKVAQLIHNEVSKGASYGDFAVLFRTNRNMELFYRHLQKSRIPAQLNGAGNLFKCREVKDMFRIVNWLVTPQDIIKKQEALSTKIINRNLELLISLEKHMSRLLAVYTAAQVIEEVLKVTDARKMYIDEVDEQAVANLYRLKEITRGLSKNENIQLVDFVKWLSIQLLTNKDEKQAEIIDNQKDMVSLITIHKAKGLEFPNVILVDLDRNLDSIPLSPNFLHYAQSGIEYQLRYSGPFNMITSAHYPDAIKIYKEQYLAEEARVLYVAMTRAEKKLYFMVNETVPKKRICYQKWVWNSELIPNPPKSSHGSAETPVGKGDLGSIADNSGAGQDEGKWRHQIEAVNAFLAAKNGILEMATGTGKTKTAIKIINILLEQKEINSVVVTVDGTDLLDQWYKQLVSDTKLTLYQQYDKHKRIAPFSLMPERSVLIVSRNQLADFFSYFDSKFFNNALIVCDEVHGMGAETKVKKLKGQLSRFKYRLGLSATPEREYDDEGNAFILNEIGPVIYKFAIEDAIRRGILCEFDYLPLEFELTDEDRVARKKVIAAHYAAKRDGKPASLNDLYTKLALVKKESLGKIPIFQEFILKNKHLLKRSIIFVETINFGQKIQEIILPIISNYHTYFGDDERINLERFGKGEIDCLIAAKRISEGIDIQSVENIILLTADRAKLQTIQRIGRSLRINPKDPNKRATVLDFVEKIVEQEEHSELTSDQERNLWLTEIAQIRREGI